MQCGLLFYLTQAPPQSQASPRRRDPKVTTSGSWYVFTVRVETARLELNTWNKCTYNIYCHRRLRGSGALYFTPLACLKGEVCYVGPVLLDVALVDVFFMQPYCFFFVNAGSGLLVRNSEVSAFTKAQSPVSVLPNKSNGQNQLCAILDFCAIRLTAPWLQARPHRLYIIESFISELSSVWVLTQQYQSLVLTDWLMRRPCRSCHEREWSEWEDIRRTHNSPSHLVQQRAARASPSTNQCHMASGLRKFKLETTKNTSMFCVMLWE